MRNQALETRHSRQDASLLLAVALFFVTLFASVWAMRDLFQGESTLLLSHWIGAGPAALGLSVMAALGATWFLAGRMTSSGGRIFAAVIATLVFAIFLGTIQGAPQGTPWGGATGASMGYVLLQFPAVVATGLATLALVAGLVFSVRLWNDDVALMRKRSCTGATLLRANLENAAAQGTIQGPSWTTDVEPSEEARSEDEILDPVAQSMGAVVASPARLHEEQEQVVDEPAEQPADLEFDDLEDEPLEIGVRRTTADEAPDAAEEPPAAAEPSAPQAHLAAALASSEDAVAEEEALLFEPSRAVNPSEEDTPATTLPETSEAVAHLAPREEPEEEEEDEEYEDESGEEWEEDEEGEEGEEYEDDEEEGDEDEEWEEGDEDEEWEEGEEWEFEEDEDEDEDEGEGDEDDGGEGEPALIEEPAVSAPAALEEPPATDPTNQPPVRRRSQDWAPWDDDPAPRRVATTEQAELFAAPEALADTSLDLFDRAVNLVVERERCSVAMLRRQLEVSHAEATQLIERMHEHGIVGEPRPSGRRDVLVGAAQPSHH